MFEVRCVVPCSNVLGECPVWSAAAGVLWWVSVTDPSTLSSFDPLTGNVRTMALPKPLGTLAECPGGGMLLVFRSGLATLDAFGGTITQLDMALPRHPDGRFNDGKCDARGRMWVGTMDRHGKSAIGELFRIDASGCTRMDGDITTANGLGWSPDGRTLYFTDSAARLIYAYDFDVDSGSIANRRVYVSLDEAPGRPDGLTVDAEGFVWSARVSGSRIDRYDPDGQLERTVALPFERPTSVCFGGARLETLYITSSTMDLDAAALARQPGAGGLFALETGIKGQLSHAYAG